MSTVAEEDLDEPIQPTLVHGEAEQQLGRYRLLYQLAFGGMATVYLGRATGPAGFDRPVAIKRIHPHLAKQRRFVEMFLDEARIISRISHPNVCSVFDFGEVNGTYFIAMEYLVGEPLVTIIKAVIREEQRLRSAQWHAFAARLIQDACEGLHAAHELTDDDNEPLHVVHRDVSPHNLFVTYDGALKVVDFGVASARQRLHQTVTGTIKGKIGYMPPEQFAGGDANRRYDVWALGVCLWEMLAGKRLFRRENEVETIIAVRSGPIPPPSEINESVDPRLDAIVLRALSRVPEGRYATARDFGRELAAHLSTCGQQAGLAKLAEWMEELFEAERDQKRELVDTVMHTDIREKVATGEDTDVDRVSGAVSPPLDAVTAGGIESPATQSVERPAIVSDELTLTPHLAPRAPPRGRAGVLLVAGGIALLAAVSIAGVSLTALSSRDDAPAAVVLPSSTPEARPPTPEIVPLPIEAPPELIPDAVEAEVDVEPAAAPDEAEDAPRERPDRPRGMGTVNVVTRGGWADVYLGTRRIGRTPAGLRLPAGRRILLLYPSGSPPPRRVPVRVRAGQTQRIVVSL